MKTIASPTIFEVTTILHRNNVQAKSILRRKASAEVNKRLAAVGLSTNPKRPNAVKVDFRMSGLLRFDSGRPDGKFEYWASCCFTIEL